MADYPKDVFGYALDPEMRRLEHHLSDLAAMFRGAAHDPDHCDELRQGIIQEYHATMAQLYALGWDDALDADSKLPKTYMPEEYFRRTAAMSEKYLQEYKKKHHQG